MLPVACTVPVTPSVLVTMVAPESVVAPGVTVSDVARMLSPVRLPSLMLAYWDTPRGTSDPPLVVIKAWYSPASLFQAMAALPVGYLVSTPTHGELSTGEPSPTTTMGSVTVSCEVFTVVVVPEMNTCPRMNTFPDKVAVPRTSTAFATKLPVTSERICRGTCDVVSTVLAFRVATPFATPMKARGTCGTFATAPSPTSVFCKNRQPYVTTPPPLSSSEVL